MSRAREVTVVVPTVGRDSLSATLTSIAATDPGPAEVVLVDQSEAGAGEAALAAAGLPGRVVAMPRRGIAAALNVGLRAARHDVVLVTHDDCRVAVDWVAVGDDVVRADPDALWTGQVLPDVAAASGLTVPSTIDLPDPVTYRGAPRADVLYPANMAVRGPLVLALGGFDERFRLAAEDNDLCFRWMAAGRAVRYTPEMTVWHADWRDADALRAVYRTYQLAWGALLAKYLRLRDPAVWRLLRETMLWATRGAAARVLRRRLGPTDPSYAALTHVPLGVLRHWRVMRPDPAVSPRASTTISPPAGPSGAG